MRSWEEVWCRRLGSQGGQQDRVVGLSVAYSSFFSVPVEKPVCYLPQEPSPGYETLMADFCPMGLLGVHLVADGLLPGSET